MGHHGLGFLCHLQILMVDYFRFFKEFYLDIILSRQCIGNIWYKFMNLQDWVSPVIKGGSIV